jgi:hypothetical protein
MSKILKINKTSGYLSDDDEVNADDDIVVINELCFFILLS